MNVADLVIGLFWLAVSVLVGTEAYRSGIGSLGSPGPGLISFWASIALGVVSLIFVAKAFAAGKPVSLPDVWRGKAWKRSISISLLLILYVIFFEILGFIFSTFLLTWLTMSFIDKSRFWFRAGVAGCTAVSGYVLFHVWLNVQLPRGLLSF